MLSVLFLVAVISLSLLSLMCGCLRGVIVSDGQQNRRKRVRTPVTLLRSLSGKYHWERYEPPYPPSYGLNSTSTVLV